MAKRKSLTINPDTAAKVAGYTTVAAAAAAGAFVGGEVIDIIPYSNALAAGGVGAALVVGVPGAVGLQEKFGFGNGGVSGAAKELAIDFNKGMKYLSTDKEVIKRAKNIALIRAKSENRKYFNEVCDSMNAEYWANKEKEASK